MNLQKLSTLLSHLADSDLTHNLSKSISGSHKIIILGNGGSNAIASHMAEDYTKVLEKTSVSFSDGARLTCYINDYGFENSFAKFLEHFSRSDNPASVLAILISSSGESQNIINSAAYCLEHNIQFICLTGFSSSNTLRSLSLGSCALEYWVDSSDYGIVECLHGIFLHSVL